MEMCPNSLSACPSSRTAAAESPPPTTLRPSTSVSAWATAAVPLASSGTSNTPIRPFQTTVFAHGVVDPATWDKLLGDEPPRRDTFYVEGRHLYDPAGNKVILRGLNLPLLDDWNFPAGDRLADLESTGANALRIQWYINYPGRPAYSSADLDAFLTRCRANHIIPILGLWDVTCAADIGLLNTQLMPWWSSDEIVAVLDKHKQYLIINLANELGVYQWAGGTAAALDTFKNEYKTALTLMRQKVHVPIMIDAPDCGMSIQALVAIGQEVILSLINILRCRRAR